MVRMSLRAPALTFEVNVLGHGQRSGGRSFRRRFRAGGRARDLGQVLCQPVGLRPLLRPRTRLLLSLLPPPPPPRRGPPRETPPIVRASRIASSRPIRSGATTPTRPRRPARSWSPRPTASRSSPARCRCRQGTHRIRPRGQRDRRGRLRRRPAGSRHPASVRRGATRAGAQPRGDSPVAARAQPAQRLPRARAGAVRGRRGQRRAGVQLRPARGGRPHGAGDRAASGRLLDGALGYELDGAVNPPEAARLELDCTAAERLLRWCPRWDLDAALERVAAWHEAHRRGADMRAVGLGQLAEFADLQGTSRGVA